MWLCFFWKLIESPCILRLLCFLPFTTAEATSYRVRGNNDTQMSSIFTTSHSHKLNKGIGNNIKGEAISIWCLGFPVRLFAYLSKSLLLTLHSLSLLALKYMQNWQLFATSPQQGSLIPSVLLTWPDLVYQQRHFISLARHHFLQTQTFINQAVFQGEKLLCDSSLLFYVFLSWSMQISTSRYCLFKP